ncbi:helix-turn-helix domain-containing protein [Actinomycetospora sp. TBRC 11914]|uniref:TetR/AcrR family transcriptional regulator n=1 Tax=Actinomycetospora sp. TBRC 11914 TaxID=2729387 RepID=UPI00289C4520|nr:helix-turn-helix domain-containing protein [Actinomycetospora sp. TBRC 11914]
MAARSSRSLRADAADNRDRVVAAARALFTDEGFGVPVSAVARAAGVAPATVYRRFATKRELAVAAFADQVGECRGVVDGALAEPDPWRAVSHLVERGGELYARTAGFVEAFAATYPDAADLDAERAHSHHVLAEVVRRARATGQLRPDVGAADLVLALTAHGGVRAATGAARAAAARRFAAIVLRGLRAA